MDAMTRTQTEQTPATYPTVMVDRVVDWMPPVDAEDTAVIWSRIEAHIAYRYSPRSVEWIVEGPGDWKAPLAPASNVVVQQWHETAGYVAFTPDPSPLGGFCLPCGMYRITSDVGGGDVPPLVQSAFRRIAGYIIDVLHEDVPVSATKMSLGRNENRDIENNAVSFDRSASWLARAMQLSGAADSLRNYRRVQ